ETLTAFAGKGLPPAVFVWAACVFDFLDGFAARALKVTSAIGKELDSLADMVSFGVLPAVFMFKLIEENASDTESLLRYSAVLIAAFSALRLAIFNVDETQRDSFKGLPTPANTLFITGLAFLPFTWNAWMLVLVTVIFSLLLVSRIELFALKFKDLSWSSNRFKFSFLILAALALLAWQLAAIPAIIILYIALSLGKKAIA
ncbi:MAG TPA: CDP-alcohol phosphatidyltransferase family protein, partial [Chryseosolibacter sp.]|nr:CDP-alcohol phosphatidyltransferase family protein [Chryseosolibacter sp.]